MVFGKQHQHTFKNDIQLSSSLHFYLLYLLLKIFQAPLYLRYTNPLLLLLLNSCNENDAFWHHSAFTSRSFSRKHRILSLPICPGLSDWPGNYRIWRVMQEWVYIVQDTCPWHQWLDAAHQWHMGKHITKCRSYWSMKKAVMCMREGKTTSPWTSAKLKQDTFQSHQQSTEENTPFHVIFIETI